MIKWVQKTDVNLKISSDEHDFTVKGNPYSLFANPYEFSDNDIPVIISVGNIIVSGGSNFRIDVLNSSGETIYTLTKNTKFIGNASSFRFDFSTPPDSVTLTNFMIEKGNVRTGYEPYIPSVKMLAEEVDNVNESLGEYDINENAIGSYSGSTGFAIDWIRMCRATKGTYKLSYTINGSTGNSSEIALGKKIGDKTLYCSRGMISDGIYEQIINITSDTDIYIMAYTNGSFTISDIKFTLQNIANEVGNLKNDLIVLETTSTIDMVASRELDDITSTSLTIPSGYKPIAMYGYNEENNDNISAIPLLVRSDGKVLFHAKNHSTNNQGIIHFVIRVTFKKVV